MFCGRMGNWAGEQKAYLVSMVNMSYGFERASTFLRGTILLLFSCFFKNPVPWVWTAKAQHVSKSIRFGHPSFKQMSELCVCHPFHSGFSTQQQHAMQDCYFAFQLPSEMCSTLIMQPTTWRHIMLLKLGS